MEGVVLWMLQMSLRINVLTNDVMTRKKKKAKAYLFLPRLDVARHLCVIREHTHDQMEKYTGLKVGQKCLIEQNNHSTKNVDHLLPRSAKRSNFVQRTMKMGLICPLMATRQETINFSVHFPSSLRKLVTSVAPFVPGFLRLPFEARFLWRPFLSLGHCAHYQCYRDNIQLAFAEYNTKYHWKQDKNCMCKWELILRGH